MSARGTSRTAAADQKWSGETLVVFSLLRRTLGSALGVWVLGAVLGGEVQRYIGRVMIRLGRLLDAIEAGRLKPLGARRARVATERVGEVEAVAVATRPLERVRIPRRKHWLNHAFAGKIGIGAGLGVATGPIEYFLQRPDVVALLEREPARARRVLGTLAHWAAIHVPVLVAHPAPRRKRVRPRVARPSVAERKAELWYPNVEGKPIDLWRESRLIERDGRKKRA